ncbi:glycoside hydrolase family 117 protein [Seonamhaeicola marinus]|uniref:Family 43 glycosylhydrolase n=1 Tax=Seonamhaeicola marinus TaxID=1912246 RepID=A0A5D0IPC5_9FLAO|nr:family 43 glycosylhydrolase [Seonamhaeicola marinus]TYA84217.1 family 43 glycosylhydrolase [Seonamhaeicola marinus]
MKTFKTNISLLLILLSFSTTFSAQNTNKQTSSNGHAETFESTSYKRFREGKIRYEMYNEFNTNFKYSKLEGFEFEKGIERYYPSSIIKVDSLYYMWYSKPMSNAQVVGPLDANSTTRAFHWDLCDIWFATSKDGYKWEEQGKAVIRGPKGRYDHRSVFNPDILVANGKYYLVYQAAESLNHARWSKLFKTSGDFVPNVLGMSVSDAPTGPWKALDTPILEPGSQTSWDGEVIHEPTFFVKGGQYYLYYKSNGRLPWQPNISPGDFNKEQADMPLATGVAISNHPEGPYIKSKYNPVLIGGHGSMVWAYRNGVCATLPEGPERNSILFSEDGINFHPVIQGLTVPKGGGCFRPSSFADVDKTPGQGITWGVGHALHPYYHFVRFECDLSIEHGNRINEQYNKIKTYMKATLD